MLVTLREVCGVCGFKVFIKLFIEGEEQKLLSFFPGEMFELGKLVMQEHIRIELGGQEKAIGIMDKAVQVQGFLPTEQVCQVFPESRDKELDLGAVPTDGDVVIGDGHGGEPLPAVPILQDILQGDQVMEGDRIENGNGEIEITLAVLFSDGGNFFFSLVGELVYTFGIAAEFFCVVILDVVISRAHPGMTDVIAQGEHIFIVGIGKQLFIFLVEFQIVGKAFMKAFQVVVVAFQGDAVQVWSGFNQDHGVFPF